MFKTIVLISLITTLNANFCDVPHNLESYTTSKSLKELANSSDVKRNYSSLKHLCVREIAFNEGNLKWKMLLVWHSSATSGPFWFLPHDNENSAFDSAIYSTLKYGGGFLSVQTGGKRYNKAQDPNRNFSNASFKECKKQIAPSPIYTSVVFKIIDSFKGKNMPYLALHNNTNGGSISALVSTAKVKSFVSKYGSSIVKDPDNLVYIAGTSHKPPKRKLQTLLTKGLNVSYEVVNPSNNDCSMSNYVILNKSDNYYNIEAQYTRTKAQKKMIDILLKP